MEVAILFVLCFSSVLSQQAWEQQKNFQNQYARAVYSQANTNPYYGQYGKPWMQKLEKAADIALRNLIGTVSTSTGHAPVVVSEAGSGVIEHLVSPPPLSDTLVTGLVWSARSAGQQNLVLMLSGQLGRHLAKCFAFVLQILGNIYGIIQIPMNVVGKMFNPFGSQN